MASQQGQVSGVRRAGGGKEVRNAFQKIMQDFPSV